MIARRSTLVDKVGIGPTRDQMDDGGEASSRPVNASSTLVIALVLLGLLLGAANRLAHTAEQLNVLVGRFTVTA